MKTMYNLQVVQWLIETIVLAGMDYNIDENRKPKTGRLDLFIFENLENFEKIKTEKLSNKPEKPTSLSLFLQILNFK
jgi:hypothetical protein